MKKETSRNVSCAVVVLLSALATRTASGSSNDRVDKEGTGDHIGVETTSFIGPRDWDSAQGVAITLGIGSETWWKRGLMRIGWVPLKETIDDTIDVWIGWQESKGTVRGTTKANAYYFDYLAEPTTDLGRGFGIPFRIGLGWTQIHADATVDELTVNGTKFNGAIDYGNWTDIHAITGIGLQWAGPQKHLSVGAIASYRWILSEFGTYKSSVTNPQTGETTGSQFTSTFSEWGDGSMKGANLDIFLRYRF